MTSAQVLTMPVKITNGSPLIQDNFHTDDHTTQTNKQNSNCYSLI